MKRFISIMEAIKVSKSSDSTIRRALKKYKGLEYQKRIDGKIYLSPLFIEALIGNGRPEVLSIEVSSTGDQPINIKTQKSKGMKFLEQDLEDIIWNAIQKGQEHELTEREFPMYNEGKFYRQYNFGQEWGIADLIQLQISPYRHKGERAFDIDVTVYELKREQINYETLDQAVRYCRAIQQIVEVHRANTLHVIREINIQICLIGRTIDLSGSFAYLSDVIEGVDLYTYNFDAFDGVTFKLENDYAPAQNRYPSDKKLSKSQLIDCMQFSFDEGIAYRKYRRKEKANNQKQGLPF